MVVQHIPQKLDWTELMSVCVQKDGGVEIWTQKNKSAMVKGKLHPGEKLLELWEILLVCGTVATYLILECKEEVKQRAA